MPLDDDPLGDVTAIVAQSRTFIANISDEIIRSITGAEDEEGSFAGGILEYRSSLSKFVKSKFVVEKTGLLRTTNDNLSTKCPPQGVVVVVVCITAR